ARRSRGAVAGYSVGGAGRDPRDEGAADDGGREGGISEWALTARTLRFPLSRLRERVDANEVSSRERALFAARIPSPALATLGYPLPQAGEGKRRSRHALRPPNSSSARARHAARPAARRHGSDAALRSRPRR